MSSTCLRRKISNDKMTKLDSDFVGLNKLPVLKKKIHGNKKFVKRGELEQAKV